MSISEKITALQSAKAAIATAITTKGGTVNEGDGMSDFADDIATIPTGGQPTLQSKSATPTTSQQTISPDEGYDGLSQVSVGAVTSAIDANIVAGNIKKDVAILGVTGTYEGGGGRYDWVFDVKKGTKTTITSADDCGFFDDCKNKAGSLSRLFYYTALTSVVFNVTAEISANDVVSEMFKNTSLTSIDIGGITFANGTAGRLAFGFPSSLTTFKGSLNYICDTDNAYNAFYSTSNLVDIEVTATIVTNAYVNTSRRLTSASVLSVLQHLSADASGKTCAFGNLTIASSDPNYAAISALVSSLTNWTITGLTLA